MAGTVKGMLAQAQSQVGVREGRDPNGNWNNIQPYGVWYANAVHNQAFRAVAWCDIFVSWCAGHSGSQDIIPLNAYVPSRLNYYRAQGRTGHFPPMPGDLGMVIENGSAAHIFIVESYSGTADHGTVTTLEGNTNDTGSYQGNGVYRLERDDSVNNTRYIYARPAYAPAAPVGDTVVGPSIVVPAKPASYTKPTAPTSKTPIFVAPHKFDFNQRIQVNNSDLRLDKRSSAAGLFNSHIWSFLYWECGAAGKAYCRAHYVAWMAESSASFGPQCQAAMREAYRLLHAAKPNIYPAAYSVNPPPTWPGEVLLNQIGLA